MTVPSADKASIHKSLWAGHTLYHVFDLAAVMNCLELADPGCTGMHRVLQQSSFLTLASAMAELAEASSLCFGGIRSSVCCPNDAFVLPGKSRYGSCQGTPNLALMCTAKLKALCAGTSPAQSMAYCFSSATDLHSCSVHVLKYEFVCLHVCSWSMAGNCFAKSDT